jgi:hypothetical protein
VSPFRIAARIDRIYRLFGVGLAAEMMARGVLTWMATLNPNGSVYQTAAASSLPFTLLGGIAILVCHLCPVEKAWRYWLGFAGHFIGVMWGVVFGGAILVSWATGVTPTALAAPAFLLVAGIHFAFQITSGMGAKWTHKQSS